MSKRIREIDLDLIESPIQEPIKDFGNDSDFVELHVYDPNDNYLTSAIIDDYKVDDQVKLKPGNDLRELGFTEGKYKVIYNFFRRKGGSDNTVLLNADSLIHKDKFYMTDNNKIYVGEPPVKGQEVDQPVELFVEDEKFWIQEVSPSRQEIRIQPLDINDIDYHREFERLAITYAEYKPVEDDIHGTIELSSQVAGASDSTIPQSGADRTFSATLSDSDQGFTEDMVGGQLTIENAFVISYEEVREWIPNPNVGISTEAPSIDIPKPSPPDWEKVRKKRGKRGRRKSRRLKDAERGIPSRKTSPRTIDMGDDGLEVESPESTETTSPSTTPSGGGGAPDKDIFMSARYEVIWETTDIPQFARSRGEGGPNGGGRGAGGGGGSSKKKTPKKRTPKPAVRRAKPKKTSPKRRKRKVEKEEVIVEVGGKFPVKDILPDEIKRKRPRDIKPKDVKKPKKRRKLVRKKIDIPTPPSKIEHITYIPEYRPFISKITKVINRTTVEVEDSFADKANAIGNNDGPFQGSVRAKQTFSVEYKTASKKNLNTMLNFGSNNLSLVTNWKLDKETTPAWPHSIIYKLYEPLPDGVELKDRLYVVEEMLSSVNEEVFLVPFVDDKVDAVFLRPPDTDHSVNDPVGKKETGYESRDNILTGDSTVAKSLEDEFISASLESVKLNIDYDKYENYVLFGSTEQRLKNFKYKLQQIESYAESSASYTSVSGSGDEIAKWEMRKRKVINELDEYEKYLYFETSSYSTSSVGETFESAWPKTNNESPYTLAATDSSQAITWYNLNRVSASDYDKLNQNRLVNLLPSHIREDSQNEVFNKFMDMIGQHFDDVYSYVRGLTDIHSRDEGLTKGISKDLIYDVARSIGLKLYDGKDTVPLSRYALGKEVTGSAATVPDYSSIPERDVSREIWKRVLNNLPFFLKVKGTPRSFKNLINCYGIPSTILRVREFGGPDVPGSAPSYEITKKFTKALDFRGAQYVNSSWLSDGRTNRRPDTVELRFRSVGSDGSTDRTIVRQNSNWGIQLLDNGSVDNVGRVAFTLSGSDGYKTISSSAYSVFDGDFWSVMLKRTTSGSNQLTSDAGNQDIKYQLAVKKYDAGRSKIYLSNTVDLIVSGAANVASQSYNNAFTGSSGASTIQIGGYGSGLLGSYFTGSIMEFRFWNTALNNTSFDNHVASPKSFDGNHASASWTDLVLRHSFDDNIDHSANKVVLDSSADQSYGTSGSAENYSSFGGGNNYSSVVDEEKMFIPNVGPNRRTSNKIRIESSKLVHGNLSSKKRSEVSSYDFAPVDSNKLGIYFAPTDVINEDIIRSVANLDFNQYLGDPRDRFKNQYRGLKLVRDSYWQKYNSPTNFWAYLRLIRYYDQSIFDQFKSLVPARTNAHFGTVIEPNIFERPKQVISKPLSREDLSFRATINVTSYGAAAAMSASGETLNFRGTADKTVFDEPSLTVLDTYASSGNWGKPSLYATASVTVGGPDYVFVEAEQPFISGSRLSEHNKERIFYYSSSLSASLHTSYPWMSYYYSSSDYGTSGDTRYSESSMLANLFFEGCLQTVATTPDGGLPVEHSAQQPTRLIVQEPGLTRLKTET